LNHAPAKVILAELNKTRFISHDIKVGWVIGEAARLTTAGVRGTRRGFRRSHREGDLRAIWRKIGFPLAPMSARTLPASRRQSKCYRA